MAEILNWDRKGLTNDDLSARLQGLTGATVYGLLWLYGNHLTSVPVLTNTPQLQQLTGLSLFHNNISRIDPRILPQTLETVSLRLNNLTECGDWSSLGSLRELFLSQNKITSVNVKHFPRGLGILHLNDNLIDNMENLDKLDKLKVLFLHRNKLITVKSLPRNLRKISLSDNPLKELQHECFSSEKTFEAITKKTEDLFDKDVSLSKSEIQSLKSPPPSVYMAGHQAIQQYFRAEGVTVTDDTKYVYDINEVQNLVQACATKVLFVGKVSAGKSSLVQTLKTNTRIKVKQSDRTVVADHHNWTPEELDGEDGLTAILFTDIGGHPSYENTVYFFCANESNNIITVAHIITDTDYTVCYRWLKNMVFKCYKCDFIFSLTQIDLIQTESELEQKVLQFKESMCKYLNIEIDKLAVIVSATERKQRKEQFKNVMESMRLIKEGIKSTDSHTSSVFLLCCNSLANTDVVQKYDQTNQLRARLLQLCQKKYIALPELFCDFYKQIGTHGLKNTQLDESLNTLSASSDSENNDNSGNHSNIHVNPNPNLNNQLQEMAITQEGSKIQFISFSQANIIFEELSSTHGLAQQYKLEDCLTKLHSMGLIIWHDLSEDTRQMIFNHIPSFVDMIRSFFNHSLEDKSRLQWKSLSAEEKAIFKREDRYKAVCDTLFSKGTVNAGMLTLFLHRYNFTCYLDNIAELLCDLNICYKIDANLTMFFPWYLKSNLNADIEEALNWVTKNEKNSFSRTLLLEGYIIRTLFYFLCVAFFKQLQLDSPKIQLQHIWKDRFFVHLGNVALAVVYQEDCSIFVAVKGNAKNYQSISNMWNLLQIVSIKTDEITNHEFSAAVSNKGLLCPVHKQEYDFIPNVKMKSQNILGKFISKCRCTKKSAQSVVMMCGIFEDQIQSTCFETKYFRSNCGCEADSVLFLPPVFPGGVITSERQDQYTKRLLTYLSTFPKEESRQFSFGEDCVVDLDINVRKIQKRQERFDNSGLYATAADNTYTEEQTNFIWRKLSPSVCRIVMPGQSGTGFIVGFIINPHTGLRHRLVLTCFHVGLQGAFSNGQTCVCEFGIGDPNLNVSICPVQIIPYLYAANQDMDYALVCIEASDELESYLSAMNAAELGSMIATCEPKDKESIVLIGHSEVKKIDVGAYSLTQTNLSDEIKGKLNHAQQNRLGLNIQRLHDHRFTLYQCHMFNGSSGGPSFSIHRQLLYSMHCGGIFTGPVSHVGSSSVCEFGVLLYHIVQDIKKLIQRSGPIQPGLNFPVINMATLYQLFPCLLNHTPMDQ